MGEQWVIQGREITPETVAWIRGLLEAHPEWHRTRLSRELCSRWDWRTASGELKDMACRTLLLKLERRGLLVLPARQRVSPNGYRNQSRREVPHDRGPVACSLQELRPLTIDVIDREDAEQLALFRCLLGRYHYLGLRNTVGESLKYCVRDACGRVLACLLFGSAAWSCQVRDTFLGWEAAVRQRNLSLLTNNTRLLILPWVRVPHLASHVLSQVARRIQGDWVARYGHGVYLLETFVDRERFRGVCYRAANWLHVGVTTGRSRNDRHKQLQVPPKDVFVYPLAKDFRRRLTQARPTRAAHE